MATLPTVPSRGGFRKYLQPSRKFLIEHSGTPPNNADEPVHAVRARRAAWHVRGQCPGTQGFRCTALVALRSKTSAGNVSYDPDNHEHMMQAPCSRKSTTHCRRHRASRKSSMGPEQWRFVGGQLGRSRTVRVQDGRATKHKPPARRSVHCSRPSTLFEPIPQKFPRGSSHGKFDRRS